MFALASPVLFYFFGILKENEKGDLKNDKTSTAGLLILRLSGSVPDADGVSGSCVRVW